MSLEAKKQPRETTQALIRRFTKRMQKSGILLRARRTRFHKKAKSHQLKKRSALRKVKLREEYRKTAKLAMPKEEKKKYGRF